MQHRRTAIKRLTDSRPYENHARYEWFSRLNPCFGVLNNSVVKTICKLQEKYKRPLTVLDLGAGTGLQAKIIAQEIPNAVIVVVEQDRHLFSQLKTGVAGYANIIPITHKLITFRGNEKFDVIVLRLVYHHVPDRHKKRFVFNVRSNLKRDGTLIVIEECLQNYSNTAERKVQNTGYHRYRIKLAQQTGDSEYVDYQQKIFKLNLCPYKVSLNILKRDLHSVGFRVVESILARGQDRTVDYTLINHVVVLAKKE